MNARDESQAAVEMQELRASEKQAQNQWANGVLAYHGSDPAASGEFRMAV